MNFDCQNASRNTQMFSIIFLFSHLNLISHLSRSDRIYWLNTFFDVKTQLQAHLFNSLISIMCQRNRYAVRTGELSITEFIFIVVIIIMLFGIPPSILLPVFCKNKNNKNIIIL